MSKPTTVYCVDTSSLLEAWVRRYPQASFPSFWQKLESLIEAGRLIAPEEVQVETARKDDDLTKWAKAHAIMFVEIDEPLQMIVADLLSRHELMVDSSKGKNAADPWVVGLAKQRGAIVVSEEGAGRLKIPAVCAAESVTCVRLLDLIRLEKWTF